MFAPAYFPAPAFEVAPVAGVCPDFRFAPAFGGGGGVTGQVNRYVEGQWSPMNEWEITRRIELSGQSDLICDTALIEVVDTRIASDSFIGISLPILVRFEEYAIRILDVPTLETVSDYYCEFTFPQSTSVNNVSSFLLTNSAQHASGFVYLTVTDVTNSSTLFTDTQNFDIFVGGVNITINSGVLVFPSNHTVRISAGYSNTTTNFEGGFQEIDFIGQFNLT